MDNYRNACELYREKPKVNRVKDVKEVKKEKKKKGK